jgi:hypothetical protein
MKATEDDITEDPTINGPRGRAWKLDLDAMRRRDGRDHAGVAVWLIEAPWAHPFWHSYRLSLIHLRPVDGLTQPIICLEGATHEIVLYALNPDMRREDALLLTSDGALMEPPNFVAQMIMGSDDAAAGKIGEVVEMICQGRLSPDTDFRSQWITLFGDNMVRGATIQ